MSADMWPEEQPGGLQLPAEVHAERVVLGSIMMKPELIDELASFFDPDDFTVLQHAWVWQAVDDLRADIPTGSIPFMAVDAKLKAWRAAGRLPAPPLTLVQLADIHRDAEPAVADYWAERVARAAERCRMLEASTRMRQMALANNFDRDEALALAQRDLDKVIRDDTIGKPPTVGELLPAALDRAVTPPRREDSIRTGIVDLDEAIVGFAPGRLIVVGARPSVGKSTLALGFARAAAIEQGLPTLFASMEMSADELMDRLVSAESGVALHHITKGACTADEARKMGLARDRIDAAPLRIDDTAHVTLAHLRHQARTLIRSEGLRLLVVDYLQLMEPPRGENRQVQVGALSRGLKVMAKELQIPIVVLSQLNRASEQRTDKRPTKADMRESGGIENDADIVILLHRPDMYEPESPRAGEADLILDKNRQGPRCTITTAWQGHYARCVDMAKTSWLSPSTNQEAA